MGKVKKVDKIPTLEEHIKAKNPDYIPVHRYLDLVQKYKEHDKVRNEYMRNLEKDNKKLREEINKLKGERNKALNEKESWAVISKLKEENEKLKWEKSDLETEVKKQKTNLDYYISRSAQLENKLKYEKYNNDKSK